MRRLSQRIAVTPFKIINWCKTVKAIRMDSWRMLGGRTEGHQTMNNSPTDKLQLPEVSKAKKQLKGEN